VDQNTLAAALREATSHASKLGGETSGLLRKIADLEAEVSRLRKLVPPISWNPITLVFVSGTASSVNLSAFLVNNQNKTVTYSVYSGTLPSGCTLSGSTVSYSGVGAATVANVQFRATTGAFNVESATVAATINAPPTLPNQAPVWSVADNFALTPQLTQGTAGQYSVFSYASDPENNPLTFSRSGGTAPASVTVSSAGLITVPATVPAGSYTVTVVADDGYTPPASNWASRSTAPGVVWAQRFNTSASDYWIDPGSPSSSTAVVRRIATDGVQGDGCLEVFVPAGSDPGNGAWTRPLAPVRAFAGHYAADANVAGLPVIPFDTAYSVNDRPSERLYNMRGGLFGASQYFNSTQIQSGFPEYVYAGKFWIQMRVKLSASRVLAAEHQGKIFNIDQAGNDTCMHELVVGVEAGGYPSAPRLPYFYTAQGNRNISRLNNPQAQTASSVRQPGIPLCAYDASSNLNAGACWQWPADTWVTVNIGINLGSQNTTADNGFTFPSPIRDTGLTIRVAVDGATSWTTLVDKADYYWWYSQVLGSSFGYGAASFGMQKLVLYAFNGGTSQTPAVSDFYHRFDEIICSTQEPALPSGVTQAPSLLSNTVQQMASGDWSAAVLATASINTADALGFKPLGAPSNSDPVGDRLTDWPGRGHYDATQNCVWWMNGTVGWAPGSISAVRYDIGTDTLSKFRGTTINSDGLFYPYGEAHNFGAADFDPVGRVIYRRLTKNSDTGTNLGHLGIWNVDSHTASTVEITSEINGDEYPNLAWFPEMGSVVILYTANGTARFMRYTPGSGWGANILPGVTCNESAMVYHGSYVWFTAAGTSKLYRMDSTGTVTDMGSTPVAMEGSTYNESPNTTFCTLHAMNGCLYAFTAAGPIYRYTIATGAWDQAGSIPYRRTAVGAQASTGTQYHCHTNMIVAAVPSVNAFIAASQDQWSSTITTPAAAWAFKP
jgi:hypothetical protein